MGAPVVNSVPHPNLAINFALDPLSNGTVSRGCDGVQITWVKATHVQVSNSPLTWAELFAQGLRGQKHSYAMVEGQLSGSWCRHYR